MEMNLQARPVILGEVLFDRFPDGTSVLGGAPFNVAWHLQGFGAMPLLISRVGEDEAGVEVLDAMLAWHMNTSGLQADPYHPTGIVRVTPGGGEDGPVFVIEPDQAYDYIDQDMALDAIADGAFSLLYHGTLVERSTVSRQALRTLRGCCGLPVFIDLNLRGPWWEKNTVEQTLSGASWIKLNASELAVLADCPNGGIDNLKECGRLFVDQYDPIMLLVTRGAEGATMFTDECVVDGPPVAADTMVDTVGAGDAFAAVTILGILRDWPEEKILERSIEFAAAVCGIRGATANDRGFYGHFIEKWNKDTIG